MTDPLTLASSCGGVDEPSFPAAAARVAAEVDAMSDDELLPHNCEIDAVVTTVLGAVGLIEPHLPQLALLYGLDMAPIYKLGDYARALVYWNAASMYALTPKPEVVALVERGIRVRGQALLDLRALVRHGCLSESLLAHFGGSTAQRKVARDLLGLSALVHENWATIEGKTLITLAAMNEASTLGGSIIEAIGERDVSRDELARDVARRNRAYTLVIRTYHELRMALTYLRRAEGDADRIAPSLYGRSRSRKKAGDPAVELALQRGDAAPTANAREHAAVDSLGHTHSALIVPGDTA